MSFEDLYWGLFEKFYEKADLLEKITKAEGKAEVLAACIRSRRKQPNIILGGPNNRITVLEIGHFPPYCYSSTVICPIGFISKRRAGLYKGCEKGDADEKVNYICKIEESGFVITSEDGKCWSGTECWNNFSKDVSFANEFAGIEEFFGLTHPVLQSHVEKLGDVAAFSGYIPSAMRTKQRRSSNGVKNS